MNQDFRVHASDRLCSECKHEPASDEYFNPVDRLCWGCAANREQIQWREYDLGTALLSEDIPSWI